MSILIYYMDIHLEIKRLCKGILKVILKNKLH